MGAVFEATGFDVPPPPWPRMCYDEAIGRFGIDRPDTRFGLEIADVSEPLAASEFKVFEGVLAGGGVVRGINAGARELSRSELDGLTEVGQIVRRQGRSRRSTRSDGSWRSPTSRSSSRAEQIAGGHAALGGAAATCCCSSPTSPRSRRASLGGAAAGARRSASS